MEVARISKGSLRNSGIMRHLTIVGRPQSIALLILCIVFMGVSSGAEANELRRARREMIIRLCTEVAMPYFENAREVKAAKKFSGHILRMCGQGLVENPLPISSMLGQVFSEMIQRTNETAEQANGFKSLKLAPALSGNFEGPIATSIFLTAYPPLSNLKINNDIKIKTKDYTYERNLHYSHFPKFSHVKKSDNAQYSLIIKTEISQYYYISLEINNKLYLAWAHRSAFAH